METFFDIMYFIPPHKNIFCTVMLCTIIIVQV